MVDRQIVNRVIHDEFLDLNHIHTRCFNDKHTFHNSIYLSCHNVDFDSLNET